MLDETPAREVEVENSSSESSIVIVSVPVGGCVWDVACKDRFLDPGEGAGAFPFPLLDLLVVVPLASAHAAEVEDEDEDATGAGAGGRGGGLGLAYSSVHCRAVLSCWARLRTNSVAMFGTGVDW